MAQTTARDILREFVEDVKMAYGTGRGDKIDKKSMDWPDLEKTYERALIVLNQKLTVPTRIGGGFVRSHPIKGA
jgi:hypothetical protein